MALKARVGPFGCLNILSRKAHSRHMDPCSRGSITDQLWLRRTARILPFTWWEIGLCGGPGVCPLQGHGFLSYSYLSMQGRGRNLEDSGGNTTTGPVRTYSLLSHDNEQGTHFTCENLFRNMPHANERSLWPALEVQRAAAHRSRRGGVPVVALADHPESRAF